MLIDELHARLLQGESIIWTGQPKQGLLFSPRDALLIPFSLIWGGFAIFWEYTVLTMTPRMRIGAADDAFPIIFPLFGAIFVCAGLFLIFGRFIVDMFIRRRTLYAITNQRVLILRTAPVNTFVSLNVTRLPGLTLSEGKTGRGTIAFGEASASYSRQTFASWIPSLAPAPRFLAIGDVRTVFDQIQKLAGRVEN